MAERCPSLQLPSGKFHWPPQPTHHPPLCNHHLIAHNHHLVSPSEKSSNSQTLNYTQSRHISIFPRILRIALICIISILVRVFRWLRRKNRTFRTGKLCPSSGKKNCNHNRWVRSLRRRINPFNKFWASLEYSSIRFESLLCGINWI